MKEILFQGPVIKTCFSGATNSRGSAIIATHERDSETTWKVIHKIEDDFSVEENHYLAAKKLVDLWPFLAKGRLNCMGYDANFNYFVFSLDAYTN